MLPLPRTVISIVAGLLTVGCTPEPPPFEEAVELHELMVHVVEPAAEAYWDAVSTVMDINGTQEIAPATL